MTGWQRVAVGVGVLLLVVAIWAAAQPLNSADSFCGSAFVSRGGGHELNGCEVRLTQQRAGAAVVAVAGVACVLAVSRRRRRGQASADDQDREARGDR
jgi:hypothetical protein